MIDKDEIIKAAHKYLSDGKIDDAIAEYLKILPYSVDGTIHNTIGNILLKKDSTDEAIKYFREAALIFNKDASHAKAIALYHKILSINPDQHDVAMELAKLDAERGFIKQAVEGLISAAKAYHSKGLPLKALGVYKKTLAVCPSDTELKIKIADIHLETNHTDRAAKMYLQIAMEYEANAESVKAEEMYKKVLNLEPDNLESLAHLSRLAEDDQDIELAFEYISKAAAIAPNNSQIMFDYSNLAAKAHKDISEDLMQNQNGPDHINPQHIQIPDAMDNSDKTGNPHKPLDLSSENSKPRDIYSREPLSTSASPLPITSTGSGSEDTGYSVPPDAGETGVGKNGIWDDIHGEDKNNASIINSIPRDASNARTDHETAEAVYDRLTGEDKSKELDLEKIEKNSRRLKRRVKSNRLHVALVFLFIIVTAVSFFVAFKFIKKSQTVDVETPVYTIPQEPHAKTAGSYSDTEKASTQNDDKAQSKTTTIPNTNEYNIKATDQEDFNLPDEETEPDTIDSYTDENINDEVSLNEDNINLADSPDEFTDRDNDIVTVPQIPETITGVSSSDTGKTSAQNQAETQGSAINIPIKKETIIKANDQEVFTLPAEETQPDNINTYANENINDEVTLNEDKINLTDLQKEFTEITVTPDTDNEALTGPEATYEMHQQDVHKKEETEIISFNEHFDNNSNNWDIIQTSTAYVRLLGGKYYIQNRRKSGAYIILNGPGISTDHNFEIETHLRSLNPSDDNSFGLVFGAKDKEDFFAFQILSEDEYSIRKYYRGVSLELARGEIHSRPESQDMFNVLKVNSNENKLSFFINNTYVDEVSDISFSNRKTGFFVDGQSEIVIDKILINHLN